MVLFKQYHDGISNELPNEYDPPLELSKFYHKIKYNSKYKNILFQSDNLPKNLQIVNDEIVGDIPQLSELGIVLKKFNTNTDINEYVYKINVVISATHKDKTEVLQTYIKIQQNFNISLVKFVINEFNENNKCVSIP